METITFILHQGIVRIIDMIFITEALTESSQKYFIVYRCCIWWAYVHDSSGLFWLTYPSSHLHTPKLEIHWWSCSRVIPSDQQANQRPRSQEWPAKDIFGVRICDQEYMVRCVWEQLFQDIPPPQCRQGNGLVPALKNLYLHEQETWKLTHYLLHFANREQGIKNIK